MGLRLNTESSLLTAREMFDTLLAGKKIKLFATCANDPDLVKLLNHLNVIKSRSKNVYEKLGLPWENSVVKTEPTLSKAIAGQQIILSLTIPNPPRKYGAFIIIEDDDIPSPA